MVFRKPEKELLQRSMWTEPGLEFQRLRLQVCGLGWEKSGDELFRDVGGKRTVLSYNPR